MEYRGGEKAWESLRGWRTTRASATMLITLYEIFCHVNFAVFDTMLRGFYLYNAI